MPGVLKKIEDKESVIGEITPKSYTELKNNNVIHSGMIPKIENCFEALKKGVSEVKIGSTIDDFWGVKVHKTYFR